MSIGVIHDSTQRARKTYPDDGWWEVYEIEDDILQKELTHEQYLEFLRLKDNNPSKILPGQEYMRQFNTDGGDVWVWRTKKLFYDIIIKLDLFNDY